MGNIKLHVVGKPSGDIVGRVVAALVECTSRDAEQCRLLGLELMNAHEELTHSSIDLETACESVPWTPRPDRFHVRGAGREGQGHLRQLCDRLRVSDAGGRGYWSD
jgi:hypothetical protein